MTAAQRTALDQAISLAAQRAGLSTYRADDGSLRALNPDTGDAEQNYQISRAYRLHLADIIRSTPAIFAPETSAAAALPDTGDFVKYTPGEMAGDFVAEAANQAGDTLGSVASVGTGLRRALTATAWIIPAAVIIIVVILIISLAGKTGAIRKTA